MKVAQQRQAEVSPCCSLGRRVWAGLVSCTSDAVGRLGGHAFIIAPNDFIMKILKVFFVVLPLLSRRWPGYITWRESGAAQKAQSLCLCQAQVTSDDMKEADPCPALASGRNLIIKRSGCFFLVFFHYI